MHRAPQVGIYDKGHLQGAPGINEKRAGTDPSEPEEPINSSTSSSCSEPFTTAIVVSSDRRSSCEKIGNHLAG